MTASVRNSSLGDNDFFWFLFEYQITDWLKLVCFIIMSLNLVFLEITGSTIYATTWDMHLLEPPELQAYCYGPPAAGPSRHCSWCSCPCWDSGTPQPGKPCSRVPGNPATICRESRHLAAPLSTVRWSEISNVGSPAHSERRQQMQVDRSLEVPGWVLTCNT